MIAQRSTQPYRRGRQQPGAALAAMLQGGPQYLPNPKDIERLALHGRRGAALARAILAGYRR